MRAENFSEEDLPKVIQFLHQHGVKGYVTLNVLIFPEELDDAIAELRLLNDSGVDAVIIQDFGLAELCRQMFPALRVHASTQMTVTSPEGVKFAEKLGAKQVVLSRELSLRELAKFENALPLEVFVHGALCVAYSGQCLTSESLGQRSANRGECAQACRMPYEIVVDGKVQNLGDKHYLLSPQDLAAVREIPELIRLGIASFKIEGRLKSPEYVTAVTSVYRKAIDDALAQRAKEVSAEDWYKLEMTFSRGLFSGWMHGVDHQRLVNATYGKKRGVLAGRVRQAGRDYVEIETEIALHAGEGVVFENTSDTNSELGGRIYEIRGNKFFFERGRLETANIPRGTRVWKTSDPALERDLKKARQARIETQGRNKEPLHLFFSGQAGEPLGLRVAGCEFKTAAPLEEAQKFSLDHKSLAEVFSRLNDTPYQLAEITCDLKGSVYVPKSELNRLKHEMVEALDAMARTKRMPSGVTLNSALKDLTTAVRIPDAPASIPVLCRTMEQIEASLHCGTTTLYADFEDIRRYKEAVALIRQSGAVKILLATPRIQKAGEQGFFKLIENMEPDGVLIRNVGAISYFQNTTLQKIGDFSLNVANPATAALLLNSGLERVTISYDLNISQVLALLHSAPPEWFELTIHQHMPMFHMEHCVFAAFLSKGSSFLDCGRPCEKHQVHLRDRVGIEHPLRADVGCRNTLFNAAAQTGAAHFAELQAAGLRHFRIELLEETAHQSEAVVRAYQALLEGKTSGEELWRNLRAKSQLGVTRGTLVAK